MNAYIFCQSFKKFTLQRKDVEAFLCPLLEKNIHAYAKRQTSDSSWEFLRIENKQIETVQNNFYV